MGRLAKASFHMTGVPIAATPARAAPMSSDRLRLPPDARGTAGIAAATAAGDFGRIAWRASVDSSEADAGGAAAGGGT